MHKSGYRPHFELSTMHKRTRYRITGIYNPNMLGAPYDPSLWIIHYAASEPQFRLDASRVQLPVQYQRLWGERRILESTLHQLERKEFMLEDRFNWPTIKMPQTPFTGNYAQQQMYSGNSMAQMAAAQRQRQQYYQQNQGQMAGPGPAKRPRHSGPTQIPGSGPPMMRTRLEQDPMIEEEENAAMEDLLDFLTPREISKMRYKQHHEWMEEIMNSPYTANQIVPVDLGLGLMGELGQLTKDLFDAPAKDAIEPKEAPRYKKVDATRVQEFQNRVSKYLDNGKVELENMRQEHAARMAQVKRSRRFAEAEQSLRNADWDANDTGNEPWRIEGRIGETPNSEGKPEQTVEQVIKRVEESVGTSITSYANTVCVQKGGLIEPDKGAEEGSTAAQQSTRSADGGMLAGLQDMHNTAADLLDQYDNSSNVCMVHNQASGYSQPMSRAPSAPSTSHPPPDAGTAQAELHTEASHSLENIDDNYVTGLASEDINMNDLNTGAEPVANDWVMVGRQVGSNEHQNQGEYIETSADHLPGEQMDDTAGMFDSTEFGDFGNLDSAGEALDGYGGGDEELGLNLAESTFGDGFLVAEGAADGEEKVES